MRNPATKRSEKKSRKRNLATVQVSAATKKAALALLKDRRFLFRVRNKLAILGLIGEAINGLVMFLCLITKALDEPVSEVLKGSSSSGKSTVAKKVLRLAPPECVIRRSTLSEYSMVHKEESLAGKIVYIQEHKGGKAAQHFIRLLQSEGDIAHESTVVSGSNRGTKLWVRNGTPVVVTTTTADHLFIDDETRFLSTWVDESPEQSQAIVASMSGNGAHSDNEPPEEIFQHAVRLITANVPRFRNPEWLTFVANNVPHQDPRIRRDWIKFVSLCRAIALCRRFSTNDDQKETLEITLSDYCVAYRLLESIFASALDVQSEQQTEVALSVGKLFKHTGEAVPVKEIVRDLGWSTDRTYKAIRSATRSGVVRADGATRKRNEKRYLPAKTKSVQRFFPSPKRVLKAHPELGSKVSYIHPITGKRMKFEL